MLNWHAPLICLFALGIATVSYAYVGYPILIWALSRWFGRKTHAPVVESIDLPMVSLLIAAHNEETEIAARIENALALRYPRGKLEIVIASDGSTDGTNEIVARYADRGVRLLAFSSNRGKLATLSAAVPFLTGEVIALSDANTRMDPNALRRLAAWFADASVGVACGQLHLIDPTTGRNVDGIYWKYETFLKHCEGRLGALLGCNGAIYAIRKKLFAAVSIQSLIEDFVIPLQARLQSGCRIVYDPEARASEDTAPDIVDEFRRRIRLGAGGYQSMALLWPLLSPRHGWVSLTFLSHKVLRWLSPFALIAVLITNLLLLDTRGFDYALVGQLGLYALALVAPWLPRRPFAFRVARLTTMFAAMNLALLIGFLRWVSGNQGASWRRTPRTESGMMNAEAA